ncbi:MAG: hypothetical protein ABW044_09005 [Cellvibrio sp.]
MRLSRMLPVAVLVPMLIVAETSLSQDYRVDGSSSSSSQSTETQVSSVHKLLPFLSPTKNILAPFTTDGCSMWIDGTPNQPFLWRHCCVAHDKAYWIGGTALERRQSDQELQKCITDIAGTIMGNYMYTFVIPGGSPYWLTTYRWGYGWSYLEEGKWRGYKTLGDEELVQVNALLPDAEKTIAQDAIQHPADFKSLEQLK